MQRREAERQGITSIMSILDGKLFVFSFKLRLVFSLSHVVYVYFKRFHDTTNLFQLNINYHCDDNDRERERETRKLLYQLSNLKAKGDDY